MYRITNTTVKRVLPYRVFPIPDTRRFKKKVEKNVDKKTNTHSDKNKETLVKHSDD